jgi:hypothetical protein
MGYDGTKLVRFDGEPHWLMPDGSFVPAERRHDGSYTPGTLYLKGKNQDFPRLIMN